MKPANDNETEPFKTMTLSELAVALEIDEDLLLRGLAKTLVKRDLSRGKR